MRRCVHRCSLRNIPKALFASRIVNERGSSASEVGRPVGKVLASCTSLDSRGRERLRGSIQHPSAVPTGIHKAARASSIIPEAGAEPSRGISGAVLSALTRSFPPNPAPRNRNRIRLAYIRGASSRSVMVSARGVPDARRRRYHDNAIPKRGTGPIQPCRGRARWEE